MIEVRKIVNSFKDIKSENKHSSTLIMDDSDVVFEGHALHRHLVEQGLEDFEVVSTKRIQRSKTTSKQLLGQFVSKYKDIVYSFLFETQSSKQMLYLSLMTDVEKLLQSDLLLEADSRCVKDATYLQKVVLARPFWQTRSLLYILGTYTSVVAWIHGNAHWSLPAICSCVMTERILSDWYIANQRSKLSKELEKLLLTCKTLFQTMRKTLNYVQENETVFRGHTLVHTASTDLDIARDVNSNWFLMTGLRESICVSAEEAIRSLQKATINLMEEFPLKGQYNDENNYCASTPLESYGVLNLSDENKQSLKYLKKLQLVYLYFQSEFLKRIGFTLIVTLWRKNNQTLNPLFVVMKDISSTFSNLVDSLMLDFRYHSSYGLDKQEEERKPAPLKQKHWGAHLGAHSARLHFQGLLHRVWNVERNLQDQENEKDPEFTKFIVSELTDIMSQCKLCINSIEHSVSQLVALNNPVVIDKQQISVSPEPKECVNNEPIPVGFTDLDPQILDEVFEATTQDVDTVSDEFDFELESMCLSNEEKMKLQIEKECSSRVMTELKNVLVHKAEEMKRREAQAIRNKASTSGESLKSGEDSGEDSRFDSSDESDTMQSDTQDSVKSDDFSVTSGIQTISGTHETTPQENSEQIEDFLQPVCPGWPVRGLPTMLQARALVGDEDTFSDSGESFGDSD